MGPLVDKVRRLLEKGYFPSQLPPPFSTVSLATHHQSLFNSWPFGLHKVPSSRGEYFSVARAGHSRRPITIPNPVNQLQLCRAISDHWRDIRQYFGKSKLSLSVPKLQGNKRRATEIVPLSELTEKRLILSGSYPFALITDVSRFFPTLYTHSIPWALHGKANAKANTRRKDPTFYGNILDYLIQTSQERQTLGIPIGPDTSHVVSEIIATAVDLHLRDGLKRWPVGYRHVDDYFLCFNSHEEAEAALTALRNALREFELDINSAKTRIVESASLREDGWVERLKVAEIGTTESEQRRGLGRFFDLAFDVAREDENALKYALKRSAGTRILESVWQLYEAYLLRCGLLSPNCVPTIAQIFITYQGLGGYKIDKKRIANFCGNVILHCAPNEHHSETVWALFLARELGISLPARVGSVISRVQSSVCALVSLDLARAGLLRGTLDTTMWSAALTPAGLKGPMWLLAYEAARKNWLASPQPGFLANDTYFGPMLASNVIFYDETAHITPLIRKVRRPSPFWPDEEEGDFEFDDLMEEYIA